MRFGALALVLALAALHPAQAQEGQQPAADAPQGQNPAERFSAYATSEGYKKMVAQLAVMGDAISAPECKEHKPQTRADLVLYAPPQFSAEGPHPVSGLWRDRIKMDRCGTTTYQNILIQAQGADKAPRAALLMPGVTGANPPMQELIMKNVVEELAKKKCVDTSQIIPVDTKADKETKPRQIDDKGMIVGGVWRESWIFNACGKKVDAKVDFSADGKGGLAHKVKL